jgi:hypothetical protein
MSCLDVLLNHDDDDDDDDVERLTNCNLVALPRESVDVEASARSYAAWGGDGYACHRCGYKASGPADLSMHVRTHSQKEHQCPECHAAFAQAKTLELHMKAHTPRSTKGK